MNNIKPYKALITLHDYRSDSDSKLSFEKNNIIYLLTNTTDEWGDGIIYENNNKVRRGWFPLSYCNEINILNDNYFYKNQIINPANIVKNIDTNTTSHTRLIQNVIRYKFNNSNANDIIHTIEKVFKTLYFKNLNKYLIMENSLKQNELYFSRYLPNDPTIFMINKDNNIQSFNQLQKSINEHLTSAKIGIIGNHNLSILSNNIGVLKNDKTFKTYLNNNIIDWSQFKYYKGSYVVFMQNMQLVSRDLILIQNCIRMYIKDKNLNVDKMARKKLKQLFKLLNQSFYVISVNTYLYFNSEKYNINSSYNKNRNSGVEVKYDNKSGNGPEIIMSQNGERQGSQYTIGNEFKRQSSQYTISNEYYRQGSLNSTNNVTSSTVSSETTSHGLHIDLLIQSIFKEFNNYDIIINELFKYLTDFQNRKQKFFINNGSIVSLNEALIPQLVPQFLKETFEHSNPNSPSSKKVQNGNLLNLMNSKSINLAANTDNSNKRFVTKKFAKKFHNDLVNILEKTYDAVLILHKPSSYARDLSFAYAANDVLTFNKYFLQQFDNLDFELYRYLSTIEFDPEEDGLAEYKELVQWKKLLLNDMRLILLEYTFTKQKYHDMVGEGIMNTQSLWLQDPYVFSTMKGDHFYKDSLTSKNPVLSSLIRQLVEQDVETNNSDFEDHEHKLKSTMKYFLNNFNQLINLIDQIANITDKFLNSALRFMNNPKVATLMSIITNLKEKFESIDDEEFEESDEVNTKELTKTLDSLRKSFNGGSGDLFVSPLQKNASSYTLNDTPAESVHKLTPDSTGQEFLDVISNDSILKNDYDDMLIYEGNNEIKAGTKIALVERLTSHITTDPWFNEIMFQNFKTMFESTFDFFSYILSRYNLMPKEGLNYQEYDIWVKKKLNVVKISAYLMLFEFLKDYWYPQYLERDLSKFTYLLDVFKTDEMPDVDSFIELFNTKILKPLKLHSKLKDNESIVKKYAPKAYQSHLYYKNVEQKPCPLSFDLLTFSARTFAENITLKEFDIFKHITSLECLDRILHSSKNWQGGSPNIKSFISMSNLITNFITYQIVKETDVRKRILIMQRAIDIISELFELSNFSAMTSIISALSSSSIFRLKNTWKGISEEHKEKYSKYSKIMDSHRNFNAYRELFNKVKLVKPTLPFFGVYLSDLIFTQMGNPDLIRVENISGSLINFKKRAKLQLIIKEIKQLQKINYDSILKMDNQCMWFIETYCYKDSHHVSSKKDSHYIPDTDQLYAQSLVIEPKLNANPRNQSVSDSNDKIDGFFMQEQKDQLDPHGNRKKNGMSSKTTQKASVKKLKQFEK